MKTQTTTIIIIMIATVLVSGIASGTLSFAVRTNSTGTQHTTTSTTGTVDVSLRSQKPLPSAGIPVIVTYSGAAAGQPIPSHFNAKEHITAVEIPDGHYDVSVSFSYPLPDVHPKYIGDCRGTIKAGDHLNCIIDPYGHAVSTGTQHTTTSMTPSQSTTKRVPSQITTNPVAHNATLKSGTGCSNVDYLWGHVFGVDNGRDPPPKSWGPAHSVPGGRLAYSPSPLGNCVTVTGQVYSSKGTSDEPDGDLQFTLTLLDKNDYHLSKNDPPCAPHTGLPNPCYNIIVEVICHKAPIPTYITQWKDYCAGVNSVYPKGQFPSQGDKLTVSGKLVEDKDQHNWREIHPATDIH